MPPHHTTQVSAIVRVYDRTGHRVAHAYIATRHRVARGQRSTGHRIVLLRTTQQVAVPDSA
eukprot:1116921-Rhodomonas_salina.1